MQIDMVIHLEGTNIEVAKSADLLSDVSKLTPAYKNHHISPGKKRLASVTRAGGWEAWLKKWLPRWRLTECDCDKKEAA